ncbi:acyl-protein thioesterase 1 [Trichodelitschia bisporula]|uniref:Acyl-protein thioesterase 1 n=1 Tax=Trichodelitschia bisporula TaxID=703511 RepID=A0A6G1I855_9PEZI|nr:acyl-protein thioesterase 1 [Trichodelitschia bisporula]
MPSAAALVVPALKRHTATVIVAHGLGDSGAGWLFLAENWRRRNKFEEVKFVFPNAPNIPITLNGGMRMPGWYDLVSYPAPNQPEDETGIIRSRDFFQSLIDDEVTAGIPASRIIIGGFSQGGAIALLSGLSYPERLGGIFALSCYVLMPGKFKSLVDAKGDANKETQVFMAHGDQDQVVKYEWGTTSSKLLKDWGYKVDFRTYPNLAHSADMDEIDHLEGFLNTALPKLGDGKEDNNL